MDPFSALARGYAFARPPVHVEVINHIRDRLAPQSLFKCALDIGCGAGLSTKALTTIAARRFGMEPSAAMLKWAPSRRS